MIVLIFISTSVFSQPPFTPPGQGGVPPGPCRGLPSDPPPCPQIPISEGIGILIAAGIFMGAKRIYLESKKKK